jgi:hypothetical protein
MVVFQKAPGLGLDGGATGTTRDSETALYLLGAVRTTTNRGETGRRLPGVPAVRSSLAVRDVSREAAQCVGRRYSSGNSGAKMPTIPPGN